MSESESTNSDDYIVPSNSQDTKPNKEDLKSDKTDTVSDSDEEEDDDDDENMLNYHVIDEIPIDIPETETEQKPTISSWPTLQILPGGVINPQDQEQYPKSIYDDDKLLYACALCPEKFPQLSNLTRHVRWHAVKKRIEDGTDLSRLSKIEREFIRVKRAKWDFDKQHKVEKLQVMKRIEKAFGSLASQGVFE